MKARMPRIDRVHFHRDYDGVVAAAMVAATQDGGLIYVPQDYGDNTTWSRRPIGEFAAVVDFMYHPDAVLWIDHHDTAFASAPQRPEHRGSPFHVLDPEAPSCPHVIVRQPWFAPGRMRDVVQEYVTWADIIDAAQYSSAAQANDLVEPHILLATVIAACTSGAVLAAIVEEVQGRRAADIVRLPLLAPLVEELRAMDRVLRDALLDRVAVRDGVAYLDQSEWALPYRRYLAYEVHPQVHYAVGIYRAPTGFIVSVGENPWNRAGWTHLGHLCERWGGGGRRSTAGVPVPSAEAARRVAGDVARALLNSRPRPAGSASVR